MRTRLPLLAVAAIAALTCATMQGDAPAAAATPIYPWCMQPNGLWGPDCYYATLEQCRAAASAVGFCYQNPAYSAATQGRPDRAPR
jgi:hypothetical protein